MYLYLRMYNIHRSGLYLLFPCHSAACIDTSEKDVQAMTGYDSPDYPAQTWWMRRDSSKCRVEFAALENFRHPKSASHAISCEPLLLASCMAKFFFALSPHGLTRTMHCIRVW